MPRSVPVETRAPRTRRAPLRSRAERDALYQQWEHLPLFAVGRLGDHPAVSSRGREDALQDARIVMLRCAELWDPARGVAFSTYAVASIHKTLLCRYADRRRRGPARLVSLDALEGPPADRREPGPARRAERAELARHVRSAVAALPAPVAAAVEARYLERTPLRHLARAAGVSAQTISMRLCRGLHLLRAALTGRRATTPPGPPPARDHSEDFRRVVWDRRVYTFNPPQAAVVRVLWEAMERGVPAVGNEVLLRAAGSDGGRGGRVRDLFHKHPAWCRVLILGARKGTWSLNVGYGPDAEEG
jgi:RNA polymerase sigma factor (sigma-70 family)